MSNAIGLVLSPILPWWALSLMAAVALFLVVPALWRGVSGSLARLAAFCILWLVILDPVLVVERRREQPDVAVILDDRSRSQSLDLRPDRRRMALGRLRHHLADMRNLDLHVFSIGRSETPDPITPALEGPAEAGEENAGESLAGDSLASDSLANDSLKSSPGNPPRDLTPSAALSPTHRRYARNRTRLFHALSQALAEIPRDRLAGVIIITDGLAHDQPAGLPDAPVHTLLTGRRNEWDRRLQILQAPAFGIVGDRIIVTALVDETMPSERADPRSPFSLSDRPSALKSWARLTVDVDDGREQTEHQVRPGVPIELPLTITHGGPTIVRITVTAAEGELTPENNTALVSINGIRDRLKVLLVSGTPHAGERTWRNLLKADPSVELVHFTILRPPDKQDGTPIAELSLIAFPIRDLFEVKLNEFDLIVFDRYRRRGVLSAAYLRNIADYVRQGGALLEAGGPAFATPFGLAHSAVGDILPASPTGEILESGFHPRVTDAGRRHPVTAGLPGMSKADSPHPPRWGRWFRQIEVDSQRGMPLMTGLDDKPLLILDRVDKGRVAQLVSDHIWLWTRGFEGGGPHAELLRRLAHWLMKEPELEENRLTATVRGTGLDIRRHTLAPTRRPIEVTTPDGSVHKLLPTPERDGLSRAVLPLHSDGVYRLSDGELNTLVAVGDPVPVELQDVRTTDRHLRPIAEATGGGIHWIEDGLPRLRRVGPDSAAQGHNWIGLRANQAYIVTGVVDAPLLRPLPVVTLLLAMLWLAWYRETH